MKKLNIKLVSSQVQPFQIPVSFNPSKNNEGNMDPYNFEVFDTSIIKVVDMSDGKEISNITAVSLDYTPERGVIITLELAPDSFAYEGGHND